LGIGTNAPARTLHLSLLSGGNNEIRMNSSASSANAVEFLNPDNTAQGAFLATGSSFTFGTYQANQTNLVGGTGGVALRTANGANAHIRFYSGNANFNLSTEIARFVASTGNLLINTTTDAGFRLDVNGTARVQGALTVTTGGADITTGTATTFIRRSSTLHLGIGIEVDGAANFRINGTTKFYIGATGTNSLEIPHTLRIAFVNPGIATFSNILWNNTDTEFRLVNGVNSDTVNLRASRFICSNISNTFNSSAQLQVDSTTRGFLPPRMTTTQKNAIASPAAGLVVYDTTLGKLCVRGAAAWETITSI
jgi:hypothetical protein